MSFETIFSRVGAEAGVLAPRNLARVLAAGMIVALAGCGTKPVTPKAVVDGIQLAGQLDEIDEEERERQIESRRRLEQLRRAQPMNCYAAASPTVKLPNSVFHSYDAAAPKSTRHTWKGQYGSGGGSGGGGC